MATLLLNPLASAAASLLDVSQPPLPTYTRTVTSGETDWDVPAAVQEHQFALTHKKTGMPWLTVTMRSRATSAEDTPTFYQGGEVAGTVQMELEREELMDDVTIAVSTRNSHVALCFYRCFIGYLYVEYHSSLLVVF